MQLLLASCILLLLLPLGASAQRSHQVSPRTIEETVSPGGVFAQDITIVNPYSYRIRVYPSVHGITIEQNADSAQTDTAVLDRSETALGDWITLTQAAQVLDAGESVTVTARLTVARDAKPGVYHGLLGFGQALNRPKAEAAVVAGTAPAVVLRLTIPERTVNSDGAVRLDATDIVFATEQNALTYTIQNPSTGPVVPSGSIIVYNQRGAEVAELPVNPDGKTVAAGRWLTETAMVPELTRMGTYRARAQLDFNSNQLAAVSVSDTFWYLPWPVLLALVLGLLLVSILLYRYFARRLPQFGQATEDSARLPLHVYAGRSPDEDHDIHLTK